jgi:FkbM family methyltransferase
MNETLLYIIGLFQKLIIILKKPKILLRRILKIPKMLLQIILIIPKMLLQRLLTLISDRYDLIKILQRHRENSFFREKVKVIDTILSGKKLYVLDIGSSGGIEKGLKKYQKNLNITLVEPRQETVSYIKNKDINIVTKLIGGKEGETVLNICKKGDCSSTLEPDGEFLRYYCSGEKLENFNIINKISFPMTTIENVIQETTKQLDYLKIDAQGLESEIIKGLGDYRPIIIKTEISFVPLYIDSTIFFHLGKLLYDMGYVLFHIAYGAKGAPVKQKASKPFDETIIPLHGDAWFMPDWTRGKGKKIILGREKQYKGLMMIFNMKEIHEYSLSQI